MYSPDYDLLPELFAINGTVKTTGSSADLTSADFGLYDATTNAVVTVGNAATHPTAYTAVGSYATSDNLGMHGNYKQSFKSPAPSKGINPKNVTKWYKVAPRAAQNEIVRLFWTGNAGAGPVFQCGKIYNLRLELQGEPILRYINRYIYKTYGVFTGCCGDDCATPCASSPVDAAIVMQNFANLINSDPLMSKFALATAIVKGSSTNLTTTSGSTAATAASGTGLAVGDRVVAAGVAPGTTVSAVAGTSVTLSVAATASATVPAVFSKVVDSTYVSPTLPADKAAVVAGLEIAAILDPTVFSDCSFLPGDYYSDESIHITGAMVSENGDVCLDTDVLMNSNTNQNFALIQAAVTPAGSGELVARDLISSLMYRQIFYSANPRERETGMNNALSVVDRTATYTRYYLIYNNTAKGNPSNALSQDQYVLCYAVKTGTSATAFEALMLAWLQAFNPAIVLESY